MRYFPAAAFSNPNTVLKGGTFRVGWTPLIILGYLKLAVQEVISILKTSIN
jgi:hypothetical protein